MNRMTMSALGLLAFAGVAAAQAPGDILFIGNGMNRSGGMLPDAIGFIPAAGGPATNLFTDNSSTTNFNSVAGGPNGQFYFTNSNNPSTATSGAVFTVNGLFSGAGTRTDITTGGLANKPLDLVFDELSNSFLVVNNPSGTGVIDNPEDGITSVTLGGVQTQVFQEPLAGTGVPRYDGGTDIIADPDRPGSFYVLTDNVGVDGPGGDGAPSLLFRLTVNPDFSSVTMDLVQDFSASVTGLSSSIQAATSLSIDPATGDVMVAATFDDRGLYRVGIDDMTGASTGVTQFADFDVFQSDLGIESGGVQEIEWDPFNNRWIFAEATAGQFDRITTLLPDGTGYEVLASGINVTDLIVIPTPGAASVLALAGLAGLRRRR